MCFTLLAGNTENRPPRYSLNVLFLYYCIIILKLLQVFQLVQAAFLRSAHSSQRARWAAIVPRVSPSCVSTAASSDSCPEVREEASRLAIAVIAAVSSHGFIKPPHQQHMSRRRFGVYRNASAERWKFLPFLFHNKTQACCTQFCVCNMPAFLFSRLCQTDAQILFSEGRHGQQPFLPVL